MPYISVLLPVHNAGANLPIAVESILSQTERDIEIVALDDGSTDGSGNVLDDYSSRDGRIRVIHQANRGLVYTLNRGLELCRGVYIARMDADDICHPERLRLQAEFMQANQHVGILGSWSETIGMKRTWITKFPTDHAGICARMLFSTAISHPTVLFRSSFIAKTRLRYDDQYRHGEDYALWVHAAQETQLANIPKVLLQYRVHGSQVSNLHASAQVSAADLARHEMLRCFGVKPTDDQWHLHRRLVNHQWVGKSDLVKARQWLGAISDAVIARHHPMADAVIKECRYQMRMMAYRQSPILSMPSRLSHKFLSS